MRKFLLPIYAILAFAFTSCGGHEVERNENTSEEINVNSSGESSVATSVNFRGENRDILHILLLLMNMAKPKPFIYIKIEIII